MNPNAIPDYAAFASSLTPDQRSYVQNYVLSTITQLVTPIVTEAQKLIDSHKALQSKIETLQIRVDNYESKFRDDTKYALTRPKIVALMKELDIK